MCGMYTSRATMGAEEVKVAKAMAKKQRVMKREGIIKDV